MFSWWNSGNEGEAKSSATATENEEGSGKKTELPENSSTTKDAAETAKDLAKNFGSFLFNFANVASQTAVKVKDTVKETVEGKALLGDFNKEQEKFVNEKHSKRRETGVPPWVGYHEEETMKSQILALSSDERNFLRDPPAGVQFHYDYDSMFPVALATLEEDPNLKKMRFNLVPKKVKETTFWRNYFYRVSLIKQSSQLTSLAASSGNVSETENQRKHSQSNLPASQGSSETKPKDIDVKKHEDNTNDDLGDMTLSSSPTHEEFISDAFNGSHELSKEDLEQIGVQRLPEKTENKPGTSQSSKDSDSKSEPSTTSKSETSKPKTSDADVPDWERELQEELREYDVVTEDDNGDDDGSWEKEIEDMLEAEES